MSKKIQIQQLLTKTELTTANDKDLVYKNKLVREVEQIKRFIAQADKALASTTVDESDNKRRIIGLNESYLKLGYIPDKDEVLGTAIADHSLEELTKKHEQQLAWLSQPNDVSKLQGMVDDFHEIEKYLDEGIKNNHDKLQVLSGTVVEINHSPVDDLSAEADAMVRDLKVNTKRVLTKFIASHSQDLDLDTLKLALKSLTKMIDQLLKSKDWVEVIPDEYNVALIKTLIYNNLVTRRNDSVVSGSYYLKMIQFGQ